MGILTEFPNCCGAKILYDFGEEESVTSIKSQLARVQTKRLVLAVTNPFQVKTQANLEKVGFKPVKTWVNGHTGRTLTLSMLYKEPVVRKRASRS